MFPLLERYSNDSVQRPVLKPLMLILTRGDLLMPKNNHNVYKGFSYILTLSLSPKGLLNIHIVLPTFGQGLWYFLAQFTKFNSEINT